MSEGFCNLKIIILKVLYFNTDLIYSINLFITRLR